MQDSELHLKINYLNKTLQLKNQQINELMSQLKQAQTVYSQLKKNHIKDQQKVKQKLRSLQIQLEEAKNKNMKLQEENEKLNEQFYRIEAQKHKISRQLQKVKQTLTKKSEEAKNEIDFLKNRNIKLENMLKELMTKNEQMKKVNKQYQSQTLNLQAQCKKLEQNGRAKQEIWQNQKKQIKYVLQKVQERAIVKNQLNCKLEDLENKIKGIMLTI